MKKKIIFFFFKNKHPAFQLLYKKPPKNIEILFRKSNNKQDYFSKVDKSNKIPILNGQKIKHILKILYYKFLDYFNLPPIMPILPSNKSYYDYIFHDKLILSNKKFICYVDYIGNLVDWNDNKLKSRLCLSIIKIFFLSNKCKYVFNWSNSAKEQLINVLNIPLKKRNKFITIYPVIEPASKNLRNDEQIRLLFISSIAKFDKNFNFFMKGGKLVLQTYEKLKPKYNNLHLTYIGYIPKECEKFKKLPDIDFYLSVPYENLINLYKNSDIFLFPTYADIFGFTFIEAMAHGLPIICLNNNSTASELVINNKTGYVINTSQKFLYFPFSKYCPDWITNKRFYENLRTQNDEIGLKNFIEKLELLIQNKELRENLGRNGKKRIIDGDLSLKNRNKQLEFLFN